MARQNPTPERSRPTWVKAFLATLAVTGNASRSAKAAKVDRTVAYDLRRDDQAFAAAWADAQGAAADLLEEEAVRRAYHGTDKPLFHAGKPIQQWVDQRGRPCAARAKGSKLVPVILKEYSDQLLMFLLKGNRPEKFRERHEITGPGGGPLLTEIVIEHHAAAAPLDPADDGVGGREAGGPLSPGPDEGLE